MAVHTHLVAEVGAGAERGAQHGRAVGRTVAAWLSTDGYTTSRGLAHTPPIGEGLWRATPPNFGAALEPHWWMVRPMALRDGAECSPVPPVAYSTVEGSGFHQQAMAVHATSLTLTDQQRDTALYWRDNPDGVTGLPSGHWMQDRGRVRGTSRPRRGGRAARGRRGDGRGRVHRG